MAQVMGAELQSLLHIKATTANASQLPHGF